MKPKTWKLVGPEGGIYLVKCYTVGELAKLVNRDAQTIRKWERTEVLPPPTIRDDVGPSGRRLYTEDQVRAVTSAMAAIKGESFVSWSASRFPGLVREAWDALAPWGFDPENHDRIADPSEDDRVSSVGGE